MPIVVAFVGGRIVPPRCIPFEMLQKVLANISPLVSYETEPQEPAPHCVLWVAVVQGLCAGTLGIDRRGTSDVLQEGEKEGCRYDFNWICCIDDGYGYHV